MENIPAYWKTDLDTIEKLATTLKRPEVRVLAHSPGGRPVYAFSYGEKQAIDRQANYNSACGAHDRGWYDGHEPKKPVVLLLGAVHGHEVEGVAGLVSLMDLLENGKDLQGKSYPDLLDSVEKIRLVIVPVANPDGRARVERDALVGITNEELRYWGQGSWKDGTLCGWPGCKQRHPIKDYAEFLGGYFNDDGINLMHDQFFRPMAKETQALMDLAEDEHADWIIQLHSGSNSEAHLLQPNYVPLEVNQGVQNLAIACDAEAKKEGLYFTISDLPEKEQGPTPPSFNLCSALHHVCGGISCVYESNQNVTDDPGLHQTYDEIYRCHMILFEQSLLMAAKE